MFILTVVVERYLLKSLYLNQINSLENNDGSHFMAKASKLSKLQYCFVLNMSNI